MTKREQLPDLAQLDECCPEALRSPLSQDQASDIAQGFAALADPARLRIYSIIASQPDKVCACSLVEPVGRSQPTVSHHLRVLYEAGLVDRERRGTWVWYWAEPRRLEHLVRGVDTRTQIAG